MYKSCVWIWREQSELAAVAKRYALIHEADLSSTWERIINQIRGKNFKERIWRDGVVFEAKAYAKARESILPSMP